MHSTVTKLNNRRLVSINQFKKIEIMRTLDSNQITKKLNGTKGYVWNSKRRYR
ncbi:hypothetical protein [Aquimarina sediminis]|uniref:hypothetical protein n=1 Tax=Aquimarina sediminis TaxID=2070536 RepID=UPI0013E8D663|nr:hypothetical protein [Aquimarina sediminis]